MAPLLTLVVLITAFLVLFAGLEATPTTENPAVILVPGAFHKASVYDHVKDLLTKSGYSNIDAIDLPSVGPLECIDRTPDILVVRNALLAQLAQGKDVVLVGNSYGATVIGEAVKDLQSLCITAPNAPARGRILGLIMVSGGFFHLLPSVSSK